MRFVAQTSVDKKIWGILAAITAFIIPVYSTDSGYDLAFETFVDGKSARTYRYSVREDLYVWVLLLPAIWVNFLTRSRSDAFSDAIALHRRQQRRRVLRTANLRYGLVCTKSLSAGGRDRRTATVMTRADFCIDHKLEPPLGCPPSSVPRRPTFRGEAFA